jgi:hypothetical protein
MPSVATSKGVWKHASLVAVTATDSAANHVTMVKVELRAMGERLAGREGVVLRGTVVAGEALVTVPTWAATKG